MADYWYLVLRGLSGHCWYLGLYWTVADCCYLVLTLCLFLLRKGGRGCACATLAISTVWLPRPWLLLRPSPGLVSTGTTEEAWGGQR